MERTINLFCPRCGKQMKMNQGGIFCDECSFQIWRWVAHRLLTDTQLIRLARGERIFVRGLRRKGKEFDAWLTLQPSGAVKFEPVREKKSRWTERTQPLFASALEAEREVNQTF